MPYLRFKGFDEEGLQRVLPVLVEEFSRVAAVPQEIVKVELLNITQISATPRSLEIYMFPRTQEKHDVIAATLHDLLSHFNYRGVHIFFVLLAPSLYYKEGMPLSLQTKSNQSYLGATTEEEIMESSRLIFYMGIALIITVIAFYILVKEPPSDYPANLIHLLFRH